MSFITFLDTVLLQSSVVNTCADRLDRNPVFNTKSVIIFWKISQQINFPCSINRLILCRTRTVFSVRYQLSFYSYIIQTNLILTLWVLCLQLIFSGKMFGDSLETVKAVNFLPYTAINTVSLCTILPLFFFFLLLLFTINLLFPYSIFKVFAVCLHCRASTQLVVKFQVSSHAFRPTFQRLTLKLPITQPSQRYQNLNKIQPIRYKISNIQNSITSQRFIIHLQNILKVALQIYLTFPTEPGCSNSSHPACLGSPYGREGVSVYCISKVSPLWAPVENQTEATLKV
jgi:hypothetical protein